MRSFWRLVLIAAATGCDASATTEIAHIRVGDDPRASIGGNVGRIAATGGGKYLLQGVVEVQFAFSSIQHADEKAMGRFHQKFDNGGLVVDFAGEVTCMAVDPVMHRAWIGGVITRNASTDPTLTGEIFQPGHDVWFRVVDYGEGSSAIKSSAQYCAEKPWPEGDARTWPVVEGNIQVH